MKNAVRIGLLGLGTVGSGVVSILAANREHIASRLGAPVAVTRAAVRDRDKPRDPACAGIALTTDVNVVIDDPEIDIVVELLGGIDQARAAVLRAIGHRKPVVTANKALLAHHGREIFEAAAAAGVDVFYEASVAGGIPIIRALRESLVSDRIDAIYGIVNGTSNFILSSMSEAGTTYEAALAEAQKLGYAEADPALDVGGGDARQKLAILVSLAFGTYAPLDAIPYEGITAITPADLAFAEQSGFRVKLIALARRTAAGAIEARVHPALVPARGMLGQVSGVHNLIVVESAALGTQMYYGRGAGAGPTGHAVVADIIDISRNLLMGSARRVHPLSVQDAAVREVPFADPLDFRSRYMLRFTVADQPGVLHALSGALGRRGISIASMVQPETDARGPLAKIQAAEILLTTHVAREGDLRAALDEINALAVMRGASNFVRIFDGG